MGPELMLFATTAFKVVGSLVGGSQERKSIKRAAQYEQESLRARAKEEQAVAGLKAENERKKAQRLRSRQLAQAAASGGGVTNTTLEAIGNTEEKGFYNAELELWTGDRRAQEFEHQAKLVGAKAKRKSDESKASGIMDVGSLLLGGALKHVSGQQPSGGGGVPVSYDYDPDSGWETKTTKNAQYVYQ